jgi:hypothetical protein
MTKLLIQIDDIGTTREMTDEEQAYFMQESTAPKAPNETPSAD